MEKLFKQLGYQINDMEIGTMIDVSNQNKYLKSFNYKTKKVVKSKILGIIRKDNSIEYKVYKTNHLGILNEYLFSGNSKHKLLIFNNDTYIWSTLEELDKEACPFFEIFKAVTENGLTLIRVHKTDNVIPIVDIQMENGCYFSEGILSHNSGGNALKFYASQRLEISRTGKIEEKIGSDTVVTGNKTKVKVIKNKVAPPFKEAEFDIIYGQGIDKISEILDFAVMDELIEKSGAWYSYKGERVGQGRINSTMYLKEHPEIIKELKDKILEARGLE
jgi:hypothetical protein